MLREFEVIHLPSEIGFCFWEIQWNTEGLCGIIFIFLECFLCADRKPQKAKLH